MELIIIDDNPVYKERLISLINKRDKVFSINLCFFDESSLDSDNSYIFLINIKSFLSMLISEGYKFLNNYKADIILLSDNIYLDDKIKNAVIKFFDCDFTQLRKRIIYKYQVFNNIYSQIIDFVSSYNVLSNINDNVSKTNLISIFSPVKRCKEVDIGLCISKVLSCDCKVMFLSLSDEADFSSYNFKDESEVLSYENKNLSLSDIIYLYKTGRIANMDIMSNIRKDENIYMIESNSFYEDMEHLDNENIGEIISQIYDICHFDYIVIYLGDLKKSIYKILNNSDIIFMPTLGDEISKNKINLFIEFVNKKFDGLSEKINLVEMEDFIDQDNSALFKYIEEYFLKRGIR